MINNGTGNRESLFKDALVASPGRKTLAFLLDYFLTLVFTLLLFALLDLTANAIPSFNQLKIDTATAQGNLYQLVYDSHLNKRNGSQAFTSEEDLAKQTIYGLVLSSNQDQTIREDPNYQGYVPLTKENDGLFYYYTEYKKAKENEFNDSPFLSAEDYVRFVYPNATTYFVLVDGYPLFDPNASSSIDNYIRSGYRPGEEIYNRIFSDYVASHQKAMEDLSSSSSYQEQIARFNTGKDTILQVRGSFVIVGYILSIAVNYMLFPILLKDGRSVGFKALSLAYVSIKEEQPKFLFLSLKACVLLFEDFGMCLLAVFLLFGVEGRFFLTMNIWSFINIFYMSLFSYALLLISLIMMLVSRKTHQSLEEIASLLIAKDTRDFRLFALGENKDE